MNAPRTPRFTAAACAIVLAVPAFPVVPSPEVVPLLDTASSPREVRASLQARARIDTSHAVAGEAFYYAGMSYSREGAGDSAIVCYEQALALRGAEPEQDALVEALCARGRPADFRRVREVLAPRVARARSISELEVAGFMGRIAWSLFLEGKADTAAKLFTKYQRRLLDENYEPFHREWRYRIGATALGSGRHREAFDLLVPLAMASRLQDRDVMELLADAAKTGGAGGAGAALQRELAERDRLVDERITHIGGKRVAFASTDGFGLSGVVMAPSQVRTPRRPIVALVGHDQEVEDYDSLSAGLQRNGYSLILLEVRGTGRSVSSLCPLPESWRGREHPMIEVCARDVRPALAALARATPVDTSAYMVIGVGTAAPIAAAAAALDERAGVLMLVGPAPCPVERGEMCARLATHRPPVFFQNTSEDFAAAPSTEVLYRAVDTRASRISDTDRIGSGVHVFRYDPRILPRLTQWLTESWPKPLRRGARPPRPQRG